MQSLLRGSTAKVNDDNDIDRTPEYKRFIEELAEFHRQRGYYSILLPTRAATYGYRTPFQPEPVVGHRKISLMKLYNRVVELGGYDWVTEEKGMGLRQ
jgi:chromatin structure-remodeling complex subunit RSC9